MSCPEPITWRPEKDGSRTCGHCGSLHPDDMIDIMWRYAQCTEDYKFDPSEKGYKVYANRPGGGPGIKFYNHHLPEDRDEFDAAWALAVVRYRTEIKRQFNGAEAYWARDKMPGAPA